MFDKLFSFIASIQTDATYARSRYRGQLNDLPEHLYTHWRDTAALEFKGIPRDAFFFVRAAEGLMAFFDCVSRSPRPCGLPSKAADSVWHAWLRCAPAHLERFCKRHFGRAIAHTEGAAMAGPMEQALASTLVAARAIEQLPLAGSQVPRLFSLDRRLAMPNGYAWSAVGGQVAFRTMDWQGRGEGRPVAPPALAPAVLLAAGLVSQADYDDWARRVWERGAGSCGSGCGSSASDGGDGGGGCGGGCGGGD